MIEVRNLTKNYGKLTALDEISFILEEGQIIGLLGPNSSGKTTFIKILNNLLTPTSGEVLINGMLPGIETKKIISYLPDKMSLPDYMTTDQLINLYKDFFEDFDENKANMMIDNLGIDHKQILRKMSKGTKEKLQLCLVMARNAEIYLLDEPIGGVDPATRDYILNTIITNYNKKSIVLISTHLIADVESILDDVIFINNGRIMLHKKADEIRAEKNESIDNYFREVFRC